jgi:hypothetical protein
MQELGRLTAMCPWKVLEGATPDRELGWTQKRGAFTSFFRPKKKKKKWVVGDFHFICVWRLIFTLWFIFTVLGF